MQRYFWGILITLAVGFGLWYFSHIFIYIIIAGILSLIGQPIDRFYSSLKLGKFRLSVTLSAALAFLTLFLVFFLLAFFFMPLIAEEVRVLSTIDRATAMASLQQPIDWIENTIGAFNPGYVHGTIESYLQEKAISLFTVTNLSVFFNEFITFMGDLFVAFFAISFITFFFLRDEKLVVDSLVSAVPARYEGKVRKVLHESEQMLKRYFIGVLIEALLVTVFLAIGLSIAGIEHALLIALFGGIVNVIPYVGPLIGMGFALFTGLTTNPDMTATAIILKVLVVFPVVNMADSFLLQPLIYSSSVKAHPLEIFLVILAGATVGGIGGMLLAVPSYTVLRVIVKEFILHFREKRGIT